jgi:pimeloyl-ACP methyl ester carboxylesterase
VRSSPTARPLLGALLVLAFVAAACGGQAEASRTSDRRPTAGGAGAPAASVIDWSRCRTEQTRMAGLECGMLEVPLDPSRPDGGRIDLAIARQRATGSVSERIGSLVINPGGPGGSGLEFLAGAAAIFPPEITERFDLVSFDPRGVAESTPVRCLDDEDKDAQLEGDLSPDTPAELQRAVDDQRELLEACKDNSGELLRHMSTADVAADVDALRAALGDDRLTYLGFSYGTSIGATYATLFPDRVRALVLDGSVSPSVSAAEEAITQATGFDRVYARFVETCNADPSCALAPDAAGAVATARASLETAPVVVDTPSGRRALSADLFDYGLATALYDTTSWGPTATAVRNLRSGGAQTFLALVDRQTGRQPDGTYDNSSDAQVMVNCADAEDRPTLEEAQAVGERITAAAPVFGPLFSTALIGCLGWPLPATPTPAPTGAGAPPILVIGTVGDPATPYEWSVQMAEALESGVLLTYEGDGHTAYLSAGPCIQGAVAAYLIELEVPTAGTSCPAATDTTSFDGVRDTLVDQIVRTGVPESVAACIVDGMIAEVGADRFDQLVVQNDQAELGKLVTAQALRCATRG